MEYSTYINNILQHIYHTLFNNYFSIHVCIFLNNTLEYIFFPTNLPYFSSAVKSCPQRYRYTRSFRSCVNQMWILDISTDLLFLWCIESMSPLFYYGIKTFGISTITFTKPKNWTNFASLFKMANALIVSWLGRNKAYCVQTTLWFWKTNVLK